MIQFFKNGGIGMFPILGLGLAVLATALAFARTGRRETEGFLERLLRATAWTTVVAFATNLMAVGFYVAKMDRAEIGQIVCALSEGVAEALSPVAFGGGFLVLAWTLAAIGRRRLDARLPASA